MKEGSRAKGIYGRDEVVEQYHCNFGFNPRYRSLLESGDLKVTGADTEGDVRVVELTSHPFYVATLFQPELSALGGGRTRSSVLSCGRPAHTRARGALPILARNKIV